MTSFVENTRSFIHADGRATIAQCKNKLETEEKLTKFLFELSEYYKANRLKANPGKTVSWKSHLNKRKTSQTLGLLCNNVKIEHDAGLKNLEELDRTLGSKQHCQNFVVRKI